MTEYSYDPDDYRFYDLNEYEDLRDADPFWARELPDRKRSAEYNDRPESKSWYVDEGVDFDETFTRTQSASNQDPFDDDMSRIRPSGPTKFFLYPYTYRNSEWFAWS